MQSRVSSYDQLREEEVNSSEDEIIPKDLLSQSHSLAEQFNFDGLCLCVIGRWWIVVPGPSEVVNFKVTGHHK